MADDRLEQKIRKLASEHAGRLNGLTDAIREMHQWAVGESAPCKAPDPELCDNQNSHPDACHCNDPLYWKRQLAEAERQREEFREALQQLAIESQDGIASRCRLCGGLADTSRMPLVIVRHKSTCLLTPPPAQETGQEEKP